MKKALIFAGVITTIFALSSCEKDPFTGDLSTTQVEETMETPKETSSSEKHIDIFDMPGSVDQTPFTAEAKTEDKTDVTTLSPDTVRRIADPVSSLRSHSVRIYDKIVTIGEGQSFWTPYALKSNMTNHKYRVKVTPYSGDPDLYIYGYSGAYRKIRHSRKTNLLVDESYVEYSDLRSNESRAYFRVYGYRASTFKVEIFKEEIENCPSPQPFDCSLIRVTSTWTGGGYQIDATNTSNYEVDRWEIKDNGQLPFNYNTDNYNGNTARFYVQSAGTYTVCVYVRCGGQIIECCKEIVCEPSCRTLQQENFNNYSPLRRVAQQSPYWVTWDYNRQGTVQDVPVRSYIRNRYIQVSNDRVEDVLYKLGNRSSGRYELSWKMKVNGAAYFNIQNKEYDRIGGGVFAGYFLSNGTFYLRSNRRINTPYRYYYSRGNWITVKVMIDFDTATYSVKVGNREVSVPSTSGFNSLGAINFYAIDGANFEVDDIELKTCN